MPSVEPHLRFTSDAAGRPAVVELVRATGHVLELRFGDDGLDDRDLLQVLELRLTRQVELCPDTQAGRARAAALREALDHAKAALLVLPTT